jgi:hypothetical protein
MRVSDTEPRVRLHSNTMSTSVRISVTIVGTSAETPPSRRDKTITNVFNRTILQQTNSSTEPRHCR